MIRWFFASMLLMAASACTKAPVSSPRSEPETARPAPQHTRPATQSAAPVPDDHREAIFAGGCFWCVEAAFETLPGVEEVVSGYTGGSETAPSYEDVSRHRTSHLEAVRIVYDADVISYSKLLEVFWHNIDPTQDDGQFCDRGDQYRSAIFVGNDEERQTAQASLEQVAARLGQAVVTTIRPAATFWVAESYHQDYYRTNASHYQRYRVGCGRDRRLSELWGDDAPTPH